MLTAFAGPREAAWKLHNRLTGVPPQKEVLDQMSALIERGQAEQAARLAIQNPNFYDIVLKNWMKPWSSQEITPRVAFNDYVATLMGIIRDDIPFDTALYDDILYTVNTSGTSVSAYSPANNTHYSQAESGNLPLSQLLVKGSQSALNTLGNKVPAAATAGVTTTYTSSVEFFSAGTNRRVNRHIFINFLCRDYEEVHDITVPDFRVARDVERDVGGDSRTYKNRCVGCHAGQDAIRGAYAYYDHNANTTSGGLKYYPNSVRGKMNRNAYYVQGFVTKDDSWINLWATGQNASLGWRGETSGTGAKSLGRMFARSRAFSQCMAKRVFKLVCMKDPTSTEDSSFVEQMADQFENNNNYNMKNLIVKTSARCVAYEN